MTSVLTVCQAVVNTEDTETQRSQSYRPFGKGITIQAQAGIGAPLFWIEVWACVGIVGGASWGRECG